MGLFHFRGLKAGTLGALALAGVVTATTTSTASAAITNLPAGYTGAVYDTGGLLNPSNNSGYYFGGIEVTTAGNVFFTQSNTSPGGSSTINRLMRSTGMGTSSQVTNQVANIGNNGTRGNDLTVGPNGRYYVATQQGVWSFDGTGATGPQQWSTAGGLLSTAASTGLTFNGATATVSGDSGMGFNNVTASGGVKTHTSSPGDDHVQLANGQIIAIGDQNLVQRVNPDGSFTTLYNLYNDPDVNAVLGTAGNGSRGAVDPFTGDIFIAYSFNSSSGNTPIIRLKADYSDATVFARGLYNVRDLDFGPASSFGTGYHLYVTENNLATGVGTIYEVTPEPGMLGLLGVFGLSTLARRSRRS